MEIKYIVVSDPDNVYKEGDVVTSTQIVNDYIDTLNETEMADIIQYMKQLIADNLHHTAVEFVKDAWQFELKQTY